MAEYPLTAKAEPSGFRKFIRADRTQRALLIISFMFVPLALLLMFTYIPFGKMVQFSFYILQFFGMELENIPYWLQDQKINNIALAATSVWRYMGQNMVMFLGAMMSVDSDLYEAAELDGANRWQQFRYIIMPSIRTIIVLNLILSISGSLSAFEPPYVITNGTMGTGTYFVIMNRLAHENQKVGLACAMAIVLLVIIILCTVAQKIFFKYFFKDNEEDAIMKEEDRRRRQQLKERKKAARAARKAAKEAAR